MRRETLWGRQKSSSGPTSIEGVIEARLYQGPDDVELLRQLVFALVERIYQKTQAVYRPECHLG
jgi:hypothetical protein